MSARSEDALAEEGGEMEGTDEDDDEGVDMEEEEEGAGGRGGGEDKVYVPGMEPLRPGEELEMDRSAYRMYHECQTGEWLGGRGGSGSGGLTRFVSIQVLRV